MNPHKRRLTPCQRRAVAQRLRRQQVAQGRLCGDCEACCWVIAIPETSSGPFAPCPYQLSITTAWPATPPRKCGCSIYPVGNAPDKRPPNCQRWTCAWMKGLVLDGIPIPQMRPDRAGVVFYLMPNTVWGTVLAAAEAAANGLDQPMARYMIRRLSEEGLVLQIGRHK